MKLSKREKRYVEAHFREVLHTTINPEGPGVVRVHLIPPEYKDDEIESSIAIVNGQDIIPVNFSWAVMLAEFISEVNKYSGKPITEKDFNKILKNMIRGVRKVFPFVRESRLCNDLSVMMNTFKQIAYGEPVAEEIEYISLGEYAPYMKAPHRMDLMVSAMTKEGHWHCNQKCIHCYAAGQKQAEEEELSTQDWKKIIDRCRKAGIVQVTFTGGEPTMREDLLELIDHSKWFVTRLNTNGVRLTPALCAGLREASLDSMQITFYSDQEETHNRLVGAAHYKETVAGIKNALEAGLNVSVNTPLCILNRDYISTLRFLRDLGIQYVTCSGLITTGNARTKNSESLQLSKEEITKILREAVQYCFSHEMEISFTSPGWIEEDVFRELGISTPSCGACLSNMSITPGGNVVPCQSWLSDISLGNMLEDSWEKIWNGENCVMHRDFSALMTGECPLRKGESE